MTSPRYAFTKRRGPTHGESFAVMATFPSFKLAWETALDMFSDCGMTVCGAHYAPAIGCEPPSAEFMVVADGEVEEYHIRECASAAS